MFFLHVGQSCQPALAIDGATGHRADYTSLAAHDNVGKGLVGRHLEQQQLAAVLILALTLLMTTGFVVDSLHAPEWIATIATAILVIYIPIYLFVAMRRVYGQSRLATTFKYLLLGIGYFTCLVVTFTLTVIVTALTL